MALRLKAWLLRHFPAARYRELWIREKEYSAKLLEAQQSAYNELFIYFDENQRLKQELKRLKREQ